MAVRWMKLIGTVLAAVLAAALLECPALASLISPGSIGPAASDGSAEDPASAGSEFYYGSQIFGSKVADGDGDVGRMIYNFRFTKPLIAYWDVGLVNGNFDEGDVLYLHVNDGIVTANPGDIRLTRYGFHLPGSRVAPDDNDLGKNLTPFQVLPRIVYVDQSGSEGYDLTDPVYLHINASSRQIDRLDLRLSYFANGPAGTLVGGHDPDLGLFFSPLPLKVRFYNANGNIGSDGNPIYDDPDIVYLDFSDTTENGRYGFTVVNNIRLS